MKSQMPRLTPAKIFKHTLLVTKHRWRVFLYCAKCGIFMRGLLHDLSKFSPTEFFESARWYQGNRSPIGVCRRETGVSAAWLHHKGRNKHHLEYWLDGDCKVQPPMPYKYAVECVCDKLAATRIYNGKNYTPDMLLSHWYKYGNRVEANPNTMLFIERTFLEIAELGEDAVLNAKHLKELYDKAMAEELTTTHKTSI